MSDNKDVNGKFLGIHEGIINFTVGQRKGIKIAAKDPLYVVDINPDANEIIVGAKKDLLKKKIILKDINLLCEKEIFAKDVLVKVRSTGKLLRSKVNLIENKASLELKDEEFGISPGQACVFYIKNEFGDRVLGGGWITKN